MKIAVSYLGVKDIEKTLIELDKTDVDFIHVDVMDGKYVQNKTMSINSLMNINYFTQKRLDIHFMVAKPLKYIDSYANLNAFCMSFHLNTDSKVEDLIEKTKSYGIKVGLAVNPDDDIEKVYPYLDKIDLVLIMTVKPGLPGQILIKEVVPKISKLRQEIIKNNLHVLISVDGGINLDNHHLLKDADILAVGSFITKSNNYQETITKLRIVEKN